MLDLSSVLAQELSLHQGQVHNTLQLLDEGATIPFIARYRKERTGALDEVQLRQLADRLEDLRELEKRKVTVLKAIADQEKLTEELEAKITACLDRNELEDLYLPYKPKRRTRATQAREKGLEPLAQWIQLQAAKGKKEDYLQQEGQKYLSETVETVDAALTGAADILAEGVAENARYRAYLRDWLLKNGWFISKIKPDYAEETTKFEMYRDFSGKINRLAPHNILAMYRGEASGVLSLTLGCDREFVLAYLERQEVETRDSEIREFYQKMLEDAWKRLLEPSLFREIKSDRKLYADSESIQTFEANLRQLLLAPPAGMRMTCAIDPGFRTGCKVAVLSTTGEFLEFKTIYPHTGAGRRAEAEKIILGLIEAYQIELIAIGNGTASRETDAFLGEVLPKSDCSPIKVTVNESGASVYSASDVAREEFPDLDATVRGAISIGRRLQDPLAELVKIDPKSIGVGQYQHDVDQKLLKKKLDETVESCVNYVGVDLNTASKELLTFVSGLNGTTAQNIVNYRSSNGTFTNRKQLLKVPKLGPKAFEQAAGFLRIRDGENPLDNTAVHPERYPLIEQFAKDFQIPIDRTTEIATQLKTTDLKRYESESLGLPTLQDIVSELEKPGRDPRDRFQYASFKEGINELSDLSVGMELEGVVTNVVNFGAFVDIGVHQDGLVHISQLSDRFVRDPLEIVKVGQVVKVKVIEVNEKLKRIALSMKAASKG